MRIAIIGAGISGLSLAWMLDGSGHDVVLFEKNDVAGGHSSTVEVELAGQRFSVDNGAAHMFGRFYPSFYRLLSHLGVELEPVAPTLCVHDRRNRFTQMLYPEPSLPALGRMLHPKRLSAALQMAAVCRAAHALHEAADWRTTVEEFLTTAPGTQQFLRQVMLPFIQAVLSQTERDTLRTSARAATFFFTVPDLKTFARPPLAAKVAGGIYRYVQALSEGLEHTDVRLGTNVSSVAYRGGTFQLETGKADVETFDHLVLAVQPLQASRLLASVAGTGEYRAQLDRYEYIETRIAVHSDPSFMPPRRQDWTLLNNMRLGDICEKTFWVTPRTGEPLFRSWVTFDTRTPRHLHGLYTFQHPVMTVDYFDTQEALGKLQGRIEGLWLAGSYLHGIDIQESALRSAWEVARRLVPESARVRVLDPGTHKLSPSGGTL